MTPGTSTTGGYTLVVDCANVMGARADGWWRDRAEAARRLRDDLGHLVDRAHSADGGDPDIVLVVEGAARGIGSTEAVTVIDAPATADDMIVELVSTADPGTRWVVVTADRELRARCQAAGSTIRGPRWLLSRL